MSPSASSISQRKPGSTRTIWTAASALAAAALVGFFVWRSFDPHAADFKTFYSAGYAVTHRDVPLYDLIQLDENPFGEVFKLPPSAALYLAPLSLATLQEARLVWRCLLVAAYFGSLLLLCRAFGVRPLGRGGLAGFAAWSIFAPAQISVGEGQWDPLLLLALCAAAAALRADRAALAAAAIGLAASMKVYPGLAALYFLGRREWRPLATTAVVAIFLVGLGMAAVGWEESSVYLTRVLPTGGETTAYPDNQALGGVLARLVTTDLKPVPLEDDAAIQSWLRLATAVLLALCLWLVWRAPPADGLERVLQLSLFAALSILAIPAAWTHYQTVLLLPLFALALAQARDPRTTPTAWCLLAGAFALAMLPNPALLIGDEIDRALWLRSRADAANLALERQFPTALARLILSYKALGTALIWGLVARRVAGIGARSAAREAGPRTAAEPKTSARQQMEMGR